MWKLLWVKYEVENQSEKKKNLGPKYQSQYSLEINNNKAFKITYFIFRMYLVHFNASNLHKLQEGLIVTEV